MGSTSNSVDLMVLGATGFTGKHVVKNLALLNKTEEYSDLTWGVSGRSMKKIMDLISELKIMGIDTTKILVVECDVSIESSLSNLTKQTKILMNATGPNTVLSSPIVRACIQAGTHYVDISAELHHMLDIYRTYNESAEKASVLIVPACGFASIPATAGLNHLEKHFHGTLHYVECYTELLIPKRAYFPGPNKCLVHYGTWQSLVYELKNFKQYSQLKRETFPEIESEPAEIQRSFFHRHNKRFWYPYPGPDHDIVRMTQCYQHLKCGKKPYHFKSYTTMPWLLHFFFVIPAFFIYYLLAYFKCFRRLLWSYPRFFTFGYISHKGPTEKMANDTKYCFTLNGKGWDSTTNMKSAPNKDLTVVFPRERE